MDRDVLRGAQPDPDRVRATARDVRSAVPAGALRGGRLVGHRGDDVSCDADTPLPS
ncbi:hypothetical protein Ae168Ps1_6461c [Pseudonocardia sp. Ae168_Ps1]|nr:hypothetical protein Ae168Ps1_6461c [Pseudonocardia sp. Ae168_Ps1]OLL88959.1 hypothetical protein Ae356Ps1_6379c [Pseudonocardia sp. Ae356_Ps1]